MGIYKKIFTYLNIIITIGSIIFIIEGFRRGLFTSEEKLKIFLENQGGFAPIIFLLFQIVQVVIPVIPFSITLVVGILVFGAFKGFLYNYIGICIGSLIAFLLAKKYGDPILNLIFPKKILNKYRNYTNNDNFVKYFTMAIFFPLAPDDFLCYLAGTTNMKLKTFIAIILFGKPLSVFLYSFGLDYIIRFIASKF